MNCNLRFLAIFFFHCFQFCMSIINIKCISYCSLWQCNLLCVILQISSTNDCMLLILSTSLISPNSHHIPQEKINPLLYFFAELHSLYSMLQSTKKILSLHDNVLKCTSSTQICSQPNSNIGHHCLQRKGRSTGIICLFTPTTLYSVFLLLARADEVPEVQYPHGLITEKQIA